MGPDRKGGEHPTGPESVTNPNLELKLYGPTGKEVLLTGEGDDNNPIHLWTGMCTSPCAIALRDKNNMADLTGLARIRWVTKMSGFTRFADRENGRRQVVRRRQSRRQHC
jgi:hypothetical protein